MNGVPVVGHLRDAVHRHQRASSSGCQRHRAGVADPGADLAAAAGHRHRRQAQLAGPGDRPPAHEGPLRRRRGRAAAADDGRRRRRHGPRRTAADRLRRPAAAARRSTGCRSSSTCCRKRMSIVGPGPRRRDRRDGAAAARPDEPALGRQARRDGMGPGPRPPRRDRRPRDPARTHRPRPRLPAPLDTRAGPARLPCRRCSRPWARGTAIDAPAGDVHPARERPSRMALQRIRRPGDARAGGHPGQNSRLRDRARPAPGARMPTGRESTRPHSGPDPAPLQAPSLAMPTPPAPAPRRRGAQPPGR
ncbi:MAG: hypothetical protein MZW92_73085 [Comamonadaceae bacterium]|nr:hypothetical protein [Comamonadaceae bacterium]